MVGSSPPESTRSPPLSGSASTQNVAIPAHSTQSQTGFGQSASKVSSLYSPSPRNDRAVKDKSPPAPQAGPDGENAKADGQPFPISQILIRRLPSNTSKETLRSMLLFAEDFVDATFVPFDSPEDSGYLAAIARFSTWEGAHEARLKLHGKPNAANDATMVVEILTGSGSSPQGSLRKNFDAAPSRQLSTSASSGGSSSSHNNARQTSRFNGTFQSLDKLPQISTGHNLPNGELSDADSRNHIQSIFSPQSPVGTSFADRPRVSGKSMINDDSADDETGELLKDPIAYARSGEVNTQRRPTHTQPSIARFASLSLNTNDANNHSLASPHGGSFPSGRPIPPPLQSPVSEIPPMHMTPMSPNANFPISPHYQRHHYPPANPADQNPPCNTLYVGNLPVDTSEDELKQMFSKQRGYKRLCFRTKHNGPMCFVEFEDVSFATKALNDLYGHPLHNSVKGGIRLSFSKNPLGVRTGQPPSMGSLSPVTSPNNMSGLGGTIGAPPGFTTASGPPPGLSMPPGLSPPLPMGPSASAHQNVSSGFFGNNSAFPGSPTHTSFRGQPHPNSSPPTGSGHPLSPVTSHFPDYMLGR